MNRLNSQLHFLHALKYAKPLFRCELLTFAIDNLINFIVAPAINTQNGNLKLSKDEKSRLSKYRNRLRALANPKISFKNKRKLLIQIGCFMVLFQV
jgi:hypothetical protein